MFPEGRSLASLYIFWSFHFPLRNASMPITAISDWEIAIAAKIPLLRIAVWNASHKAMGSWQAQKQNRLISVGVMVSPAPLKAWIATMPQA